LNHGAVEAAGAHIDAAGNLLAPGFIDLQINGAFGQDFTENPGAIWEVARRLPEFGVTAFLPTIVTSAPEKLEVAVRVLGRRPAGFAGAEPLGLHVEGPYLNPDRRGAHNPSHLRTPEATHVPNWSPSCGVRVVTLAPELPGALALIAALVARGIVVGIGHSIASHEQAVAGIDAGARYGTHLFNAMAPLGHREPGVVGALLTDDRMTVGLIADGIHTHPELVKLAWRALGPARLNLVTDAMAALGMPPGRYSLGGLEVLVDDAGARLPDGRLAGSTLSLDAAVRNLVAMAGCTPEAALQTVTETPARLLGVNGRLGVVEPGAAADLVLLDAGLQVRATLVGGEPVYRA
jgi:N-acetylglucosamine-6-phosphate deacetylase